MYAVESLENIVIFELIRSKYKQSNLPGLISKTAFCVRKYDTFSGIKYRHRFHRAANRICESWMRTGLLTYLKNRILLWFREIVDDILEYGIVLIKSLKQYSFRVKFCIERIWVTQHGRIDRAKTILSILKDSQFLIEFQSGTLFNNMVMKKDIVTVSQEVLNSIKDSTDFYQIVKIKAAVSDMLRLYFMDIIYIANEYVCNCTKELTSNVVAAIMSLFQSKSYEGVRKLCDHMDVENRRKFLIKNKWQFMSKDLCLDGEMIHYIFLNYTSEEWIEALKVSFNELFDVIISDWRCRGFAVTVYKDALKAGIIDLTKIIHILSLGHQITVEYDDNYLVLSDEDELEENYDILCWYDHFSSHETIQIIKNIWFYTPLKLKNCLKRCILGCSNIRALNAESIMFIIDSYSINDQSLIVTKLMEDINKRVSKHYKVSEYNKLFNMYLDLKSKSHNQLFVNEDVISQFRSHCDI